MVAMNLEVKLKSNKLPRMTEKDEQESNTFILERIERIEKYVQYLASTIDDFRNFFKPQKEKREFYANTLLDETIDLIAPTLDVTNINLHKSYNALMQINSYENEIKQVILNILNNAKDALIEKECASPCIMIRTYEEATFVVMEIENNGAIIEASHLKQIFDPYFSTKSKNGTGLGLYMSKTIIEEHCKGKLTVRNCPDGVLFTIKLPLS